MNKKISFTIGTMVFNEKHKFFHGYLNGQSVTLNKGTDKDGKEIWYAKQTLNVYETEETKETKEKSF
jgi:hypothetical protein